MAILIDASVFCAYSNTKDVHHWHSKKIITEIVSDKYGSPISTDYIFDETVTVVKRKCDKKFANEIGMFILDSEILVARIDQQVFQRAWKIFQEQNELSFTDCTSIAFMQAFGIKDIATFDKEFDKIKGLNVIKD